MTRRDFDVDVEDKFQDWISDDNFEGFVETLENVESTDEPSVPAYRLSSNIVYQHPWSYFPQWHFLRESVRDFLLWSPRDDSNSIVLLALLYPLWALLTRPLFLKPVDEVRF